MLNRSRGMGARPGADVPTDLATLDDCVSGQRVVIRSLLRTGRGPHPLRTMLAPGDAVLVYESEPDALTIELPDLSVVSVPRREAEYVQVERSGVHLADPAADDEHELDRPRGDPAT